MGLRNVPCIFFVLQTTSPLLQAAHSGEQAQSIGAIDTAAARQGFHYGIVNTPTAALRCAKV